MQFTMDFMNHFNYHCLSKEESNNPVIPQILKFGKMILSLENITLSKCSIAIPYGKRLIISKNDAIIHQLHREDIIEIIDVDPIKNLIIYFGPSQPPLLTPFLWMISYAKKEIQYIISLEMKFEKENNIAALSHINKENTFLNTVKLILKQLQKQDIIKIDDHTLILTTQTKEDMKNKINYVRKYDNKW